MTASANGQDVLSAVISEPRVGAWSAELDCDGDVAFSGTVTISIDGVRWKGTAVRGDTYAGRAHARVVGGGGKLTTVLAARHYLNASLYTVLADIAANAGETLSSTCDASLRSIVVAHYTRLQSSAGLALKELAQQAQMSWRTLRDGTLWVGNPSWAVVAPSFDEIDKAPSQQLMVIAPETPTLEPGTTFAGQRVSRVITRIVDGTSRQDVTFDDGDGSQPYSRGVADQVAFIEAVCGARFDYSRSYPCKVVGQSADLSSLDLLPDHPKVRGTGTTHVPIRHGIPGVKVTVPNGNRVLLFFEEADRTKPACALWPDGSSVTAIDITAPTLTIHGNLMVTGEVTAKSNSLTPIALSTHEHPTAMGPSGEPIPSP